jgi:hypothetical protein
MGPTPVVNTALLLAQAGGDGGTSVLDNVKTIADIVRNVATAVALIVGGIWAYFKFVKGRTYRPRLEIGLFGQWRLINGEHQLHARITVKNIGASVVTLLQPGTGLRVSLLATEQPAAPAPAVWESQRVFKVLVEHQWIEPGETVSDDLLLRLDVTDPVPTLFEARLVWRWSKRGGNIEVFARRVIAVESTIDEKDKAGRDGQGGAADAAEARGRRGVIQVGAGQGDSQRSSEGGPGEDQGVGAGQGESLTAPPMYNPPARGPE